MPPCGDKARLYVKAVNKPEEVFFRTISGDLGPDPFKVINIGLFFEEFPQRGGQICHIIKGGGEPFKEPLPYLSAPECVETEPFSPLLRILPIQSLKIDLRF